MCIQYVISEKKGVIGIQYETRNAKTQTAGDFFFESFPFLCGSNGYLSLSMYTFNFTLSTTFNIRNNRKASQADKRHESISDVQ